VTDRPECNLSALSFTEQYFVGKLNKQNVRFTSEIIHGSIREWSNPRSFESCIYPGGSFRASIAV